MCLYFALASNEKGNKAEPNSDARKEPSFNILRE